MWLRYHCCHLAEFGWGKYLIVRTFLVHFGGISGRRFGLAKIRTMLDQTRLMCRLSVSKQLQLGIQLHV